MTDRTPDGRALRAVFFGTPDFAVPTLDAMVRTGTVPRMVVSQPDRPVGRGRRMQAPPVASRARELGLPLRQPEKVRDAAFRAELEELNPDVAVVVAYGQIFPRSLLSLPRLGCVNLHASLLPRWRGAAPIHAAIAAGDETTGVTTMRMEAGLDTGPILQTEEVVIGADETTPDLAERLSTIGAELMVETLRGLAEGALRETPQPEEGVTLAPRLDRSDGVVDWSADAERLYARWRAFRPWPGLTTTLDGEMLKLVEVVLLDGTVPSAARPGTLLEPRDGCVPVVCGGVTMLGLRTVQRPGRRPVVAPDLFHGEELAEGTTLG